ncbi:flagellar FliL protein [Novimethylophilus kurashikiensis]|uniref:Flagellar protein FliL n=1 Tax=Novimethylophilus kurashikiensis TaxID=1825523 RepID=A0A2R5F1H3_9PROT|nr:flagellar basal body-associated FliL family protein [Novimethylophilus kurashikiensis]GBG12567.1 flagellar FliL protein [Novimethylophilus kurashikiensis]
MAKDPAAAPEAPASKKKLIIIIAAVLILAIVGGGAAFMLMGGKKKHGKNQEEVVQEEGASEEEAPAAKLSTVAFEEKFTVNLRTEDGSNHFIQVPKVELEVANEKIVKKVEETKSKISDRISSTLRSKTMQEMMEPGSDLKLKEELRKVINETIGIKDPSKGVKEVILPSSFIVQ